MIRHLPDPSTDHDRAPDFEGLTRELIQRAGQRFIDSRGNAYLACEFDANSIDGFPWRLRDERCGTLHWYSESGEWIAGSKDPSFNLVGPAPDAEEREQLKRHNAELIAENGALKRRRTGNIYTVDAPIHNIAPCDVEAEVSAAIRQALDTAFCVQYMRLPILVQIAFAGDTNAAPLHLEGEAWNQFIDGDVLWGASLVESEWKDRKFVGVYEVEAR